MALDLTELSRRESEQVEWKENVADTDDVAATLAAFANDLPNLGGGYVVCGAAEVRDEFGFPSLRRTGLTPSRLKEIEGKVLEACRDRCDPAIVPLVEEAEADAPDRRLLVLTSVATRRAHVFRRRGEAGQYHVRVGRSTIAALNGVLRELMVRKGEVEEWDRRPCATATVEDIDLLDLRDGFQRMGLVQAGVKPEDYLSDTRQLSPFVPRCARRSRSPDCCGPATSRCSCSARRCNGTFPARTRSSPSTRAWIAPSRTPSATRPEGP